MRCLLGDKSVVAISLLVFLPLGVTALVGFAVWQRSESSVETKVQMLAGMIAVVTALTYSILTLGMFQEARLTRLNDGRPYIYPFFSNYGETSVFGIINLGKGHAAQIKMDIDPMLIQSVGRRLDEHFIWKDSIPYLPPGASITIPIYKSELKGELHKRQEFLIRVGIEYSGRDAGLKFKDAYELSYWHFGSGSASDSTGTWWPLGLSFNTNVKPLSEEPRGDSI